MFRLAHFAAIAVFAVSVLGGCATQSNLLKVADREQMNLTRVEFKWAPNAEVVWDAAFSSFTESLAGKPELRKRFKKEIERAKSEEQDDQAMASIGEYNLYAASPEGRAHMRKYVEDYVRAGLTREVLPRYQSGNRDMHLRLTVHAFQIPNAAMRVLIGGSPIMGIYSELVDSKTGQVLAKMDRATGAPAGNGVLGVLVDQAFDSLEKRLRDAYIKQLIDWLGPRAGERVNGT